MSSLCNSLTAFGNADRNHLCSPGIPHSAGVRVRRKASTVAITNKAHGLSPILWLQIPTAALDLNPHAFMDRQRFTTRATRETDHGTLMHAERPAASNCLVDDGAKGEKHALWVARGTGIKQAKTDHH